MVLKVDYIIINQEIECNIFAVLHFALTFEAFFWYSFKYFNKVFVINSPKTNQLLCRHLIVMVVAYPIVLIVRNCGSVFKL